MEAGFTPKPTPNSRTWMLVLVMIAVSASFAGNSVIVKVALTDDVDPVVFSFLRDVGGSCILLSVCRYQGNLIWPRRETSGSSCCSAFGVTSASSSWWWRCST